MFRDVDFNDRNPLWNWQGKNKAILMETVPRFRKSTRIDRCQYVINNAAAPYNIRCRLQSLKSTSWNYPLTVMWSDLLLKDVVRVYVKPLSGWDKWVLTNFDHDRQWFNTLIPPSHESAVVYFIYRTLGNCDFMLEWIREVINTLYHGRHLL